jgi:molybdopterin converting factor small subunit
MKIKLTGDFATSVGQREIDVSGFTNVKGLLNALDSAYPNHGWGDCNIAINGTMYSNAWLQPITESDEIVIMPPIEGG